MAKAIKTNVLRHLDALKIPYETREYTVDDDNFDGKLVAEKVDLPAEMIYKTLVLVGDTLPHLVCVIPVELELDLKAVARAAGQLALFENVDVLALHLGRYLVRRERQPADRLPARRMQPHRHEESVPHLRGQRGAAFGACQRQRGRARVPGDSGGGCACRLHKSEIRRPVPGLK